MTVRIAKQPIDLRSKLSELERPIGLKGSELMRSETAQDARDFVSAGRKNLIINGDFQVSQRGTSATSISSDTYHTVDRWKFVANSSGTFTLSKESDAPPGFSNSLKYLCTTADSSPSYLICRQNIEGQNLQQLGYGTSSAKHITFSFWVKSNITGTYSLGLVNIDATYKNNSLYYTINSPGTWEYKTLTFNPDTSTGFDNDNELSMEVNWWLGASGTYNGGSSTNGNWVNLTDSTRAGSAQVGTAVNNYWQIAGVQLEVGKNATEFEHRSYGEELALCQRYCQRYTKLMAAGVVGGSTESWHPYTFSTQFRATPVLTVNSLGRIVKEGVAWYANTAISLNDASPSNTVLACTQSNNAMSALDATRLGYDCDLTFSAEL